jgi:hypothetical protein
MKEPSPLPQDFSYLPTPLSPAAKRLNKRSVHTSGKRRWSTTPLPDYDSW